MRAYSSYFLTFQLVVQVFHQAEACLGEKDYEGAIYNMESLLHTKNYRLVFKLMRKIIQTNLEAGEEGISKLQKYSEPRNELYAGFITLVYTLEEMKEEKKAAELRDWIRQTFD